MYQYLTPDEKKVVAVTLRNNSYFAHPEIENLLLSALLDSRIKQRKFAVQKILNARKRTSTEVRQFLLPNTLNLDAREYMDLIDFSKETTTEPPLTTKLTDAELVGYVNRERLAPNTIPCHSQNVESVVADVAQAAKNNMGQVHLDLDGAIDDLHLFLRRLSLLGRRLTFHRQQFAQGNHIVCLGRYMLTQQFSVSDDDFIGRFVYQTNVRLALSVDVVQTRHHIRMPAVQSKRCPRYPRFDDPHAVGGEMFLLSQHHLSASPSAFPVP